ncbi:MAG: RHS repeat-associated core domain-containing protein [Candidatus Acidiferrum sp.]
MKSSDTIYWYGSGGDILAETGASGNTLNEYIFFGGKRVAMLPAGGNAQFYAEDFLGSARVITTNNGTVCYDADFDPYGGEHPYTNTCSQNYKFEGKERDTETGNDDFGARYYSERFGRWLGSDWSSVPVAVPYANLTNPQTLNLYAGSPMTPNPSPTSTATRTRPVTGIPARALKRVLRPGQVRVAPPPPAAATTPPLRKSKPRRKIRARSNRRWFRFPAMSITQLQTTDLTRLRFTRSFLQRRQRT